MELLPPAFSVTTVLSALHSSDGLVRCQRLTSAPVPLLVAGNRRSATSSPSSDLEQQQQQGGAGGPQRIAAGVTSRRGGSYRRHAQHPLARSLDWTGPARVPSEQTAGPGLGQVGTDGAGCLGPGAAILAAVQGCQGRLATAE
jgi:hypothetical protein